MTCGIYAIIDIHGERYIGSSVRIEERIKGHFKALENNKHASIFLQRTYNKYGKKYFRSEIIEICSQKEKIKREQFHMDISSKYNLAKTAMGSGGIKWKRKRKKKFSQILKGNKHLLGHKHSKETKRKISMANKGRKPSKLAREKARVRMIKRNKEHPPMKNRNFSKHHRKAISNAMRGKKRR